MPHPNSPIPSEFHQCRLMLYHRDGNHHIASYALDGRNRFRKAERAKASGARIEWRLPFESRRKVLVATWEFEWDGERAWMTR